VEFLVLLGGFVFILFVTLAAFATRYRRCPSDKILVIYGKIAGGGSAGLSAKCYHGGAAFVWPVIQDYQFLDLTPIPIDIKLTGALSQQNIRINTPSTFTVGISTEPGVMENAAERILGLSAAEIQDLAKDIIFGQMRVIIATMPIEAAAPPPPRRSSRRRLSRSPIPQSRRPSRRAPRARRRRSTQTSSCRPRSRSSGSRRWPRPRPNASGA
jgi:hypothetical protein